jgi:hypothetical protein
MSALPLLLAALHLAPQVQDTSPFRPLDLPAPNAFRAADGRPGPHYWQQRVDYRIEADLDTDRHVLSGRETVRYVNNSPHTLTQLWMFLDQNICAPNSVTNQLNQLPLQFGEILFDFSCAGFDGGITLESVRAGGRPLPHEVRGTLVRLDLPAPLEPGGEFSFDLAWSFRVPEYGAARMGRDGSLYEIAWWYPRMVVYDDVRGWNNDPFIGAGEFYLEYGSFEVSLTVPAEFVVTATGTLANPDEVLTAVQRERLANAMRTDEPIAIITAGEAGTSGTRPRSNGTMTWRFTADGVRDFAFAAAPNFRWDAVGWNGILIQTFYRPEATLWEEAIEMARQSIRHFSERLYPYPYPHATTIEGPIEGMEYPMLTFVPTGPTREDLYWVLAHEFGHEWYPMIVGSNERLHPWMDEGFNTFIDIEATEEYFAGTDFGATFARGPLEMHPDHAIPGAEQPIATRPVESRDLFWTAYQKPALMLHLLRYEVLGKEIFDRAFRAYTEAWAYKHPTPADFFRVIRNESGQDLDWFWRGWIYTTARLDQGIDSVTSTGDTTFVHLSNHGRMVMPTELRFAFAGGGEETVKLPVEMWNLGSAFTYRLRGPRQVVGVTLDPRAVLPDIDRGNNTWRN